MTRCRLDVLPKVMLSSLFSVVHVLRFQLLSASDDALQKATPANSPDSGVKLSLYDDWSRIELLRLLVMLSWLHVAQLNHLARDAVILGSAYCTHRGWYVSGYIVRIVCYASVASIGADRSPESELGLKNHLSHTRQLGLEGDAQTIRTFPGTSIWEVINMRSQPRKPPLIAFVAKICDIPLHH